MPRVKSSFKMPIYSSDAIKVLEGGNILLPNESTDEMITRVLETVFSIEEKFGTSKLDTEKLKSEFSEYLADKLVILGSPTLTNAGRNNDMALSSCVAIPVDLRRPFHEIRHIIEAYYYQNMGSGFNFSNLEDPAQMVRLLNQHAAEETKANKYARYIGNMGNLDIDHPKVEEFIHLKSNEKGIKHFNLSVNVTERFINAVREKKPFRLKNGKFKDAEKIWSNMVNCAWKSGDPGILFLERFNFDNPTPVIGEFTTTAPCAEVGLAPGESCVFGYINLGNFYKEDINGVGSFDYELLEKVVPLTTRVLDNCLEISLNHYPSLASQKVMGGKRKIGVGACGFADLLVKMGIPYASKASIELLQNILTTISYTSKVESLKLGKTRGSFSAFSLSKYNVKNHYLVRKYRHLENSRIGLADWRNLEKLIKHGKSLRNATTTALPPTGRSALILDASTSIEPHFSLKDLSGNLRPSIIHFIEKVILNPIERKEILNQILREDTTSGKNIPIKISRIVKRATELSPDKQLRVVAATVNCIDEGASKTVNVAKDASPKDISDIFFKAWDLGLKAISIYRDGSHSNQPEDLS